MRMDWDWMDEMLSAFWFGIAIGVFVMFVIAVYESISTMIAVLL